MNAGADHLEDPPAIRVSDLADAMHRGEIWPALQPLIHIESGAVVAFEVLLRWTSQRFGAVPPQRVVQLALEGGLLNALTCQLITQAASAVRDWDDGFCLAFNTAPAQYLDAEFVPDLLEAVRFTGLPPCRVKIEVTEDDIFADASGAQEAVRTLKAAGLRLSLDDFGTGHSSLTRLQMLPFDEIKIDASFVQALESSAGNRRIVSAVIGLGQSLDMNVVAEGVETAEQARLLLQMGCTIGQGYHWSPPVALPQALALLRQRGVWSRRGEKIDTSPFQRLHQLEAMYREAPVGLCFLDPSLRVASTNRVILQYLGIGHANVLGVGIMELLDPVENADLIAALQAVRDGQIVPPAEYRHSRTGGAFLVSHQRVLDSEQMLLGVSVVVLDISERVKVVEELRANAEHYRQAIELSPYLAWAADSEGVVDFIGPSIDGATHTTVAERHAAWVAQLHPEDLHSLQRAWQEHREKPPEPSQTEFRMRWPGGQWRWMRSRANPMVNAQGQVTRWFGIITDVSRERALGEQVQHLQDEVRRLRPP
ncbi:MAG: EAL domain-containing protein [Acidovorax sp.]|nr:EAL domain-containing protein [Acidovorax sp.]